MVLQRIPVKVDQVVNHLVYNIVKPKVRWTFFYFGQIDVDVGFLVSKPAPFFEGIVVINGEFKEISLNDFKDKYLVLLFYPLDL